MHYLMYFDDNPKKALAQKIAEAKQRYLERFGAQPATVLVNEADLVALPGLEARLFVRRSHFWLGPIGA
jgi:hypothetical protein